ncbi:putative transmembrane protein [Nitrospirillum viridazoti Y2]|uniref:Transmembrane protein n=1 Tax=Nitrospirillum amazonense TaxID=28077 RepID=A0A560I6P3_9PROT|nr:hypothetical protein [Nitrospirillum amazonense]EGY00016.1 putative transmembrane protein [Nitrospirillum amazonense Y2]TWB52824.1 hypothetical protein FBZ92_11770 [Nitrospirillum amazonense]
MDSAADRFRKRKAALDHNSPVAITTPVVAIEPMVEAALPVRLEERAGQIAVQADALLAELHGRIDEEKISALIDSCQNECLQAVIRPFGVAKILFEDKVGGSVDTVHNVRNEVFATGRAREKYKSNKKYDSHEYHNHDNYKKVNKENSTRLNRGIVKDSYSGGEIIKGKMQLDHVISAHEIHDDAGRILAGLDGSALANVSGNLKPTSQTINGSKKDKSVAAYLKWLDDTKIPTLAQDIARLEEAGNLSAEKAMELIKNKKKLKELQKIDRAQMTAADVAARKYYNGKINKAYYTSGTFIKDTALTSVSSSGRLALHQAIGVLMEEFTRAAFAEMRDVWLHGFKNAMDVSFLEALKERLSHIAARVQAKWRIAMDTAIGGGISGFLSNLITVLINTFTTTKAHVARLLREGALSLGRAFRTLAFPADGTSLAEAADAASKVLAAGLITGGGILLETALEHHVIVFGPLAPYVLSVGIGITTGLCTAFAIYMLDRLDLFGVHGRRRHDQIMAKLDLMISTSYDRALEAAAVFDPPALLPAP